MRNKKNWFGILVIVLVLAFGMAVVGCDNDDGTDNGVDSYPTTINLVASLWDEEDDSGETMNSSNQIKLSDLTSVKPVQRDDVFNFKISGNANVQLKYCDMNIFQMQGDNWGTYKWLGSSSIVELPNPFEDYIFEITIWAAPEPNLDFYVCVENTLWRKDSSGTYTYNSGHTLTPGTKNGDVVGTISDFSISLVVE